jgi:arylsulfatase A
MRKFLLVLWVLVSFGPRVASAAEAAASSRTRPNVIFILADDLGYGDVGCFGQRLIRTPNIDRLAAEGMRFTQAYAGTTVCAPSRCALMTGQHTGHCPIRGNKEIKPEGQEPMPADTYTVAHLMRGARYATGLIGKWGLGYPGSASTPDKMGFDYFFGYNCQMKAHEYYPEYLWRNNEKVELGGKSYSHDLLAADSLEFVKRNKERPFFLYLAFTIPHQKLQVPDLGPYENEPWPANQKKMASMVTRMDRDVGRLMALLKELGIDERTLVFFASDNGAVYTDKVFNHSGPLRGFKRDMYEGGLRSPSIARWPGRIRPGVVSDQVWAFWDLLPTLAELTGQSPPPAVHLDGVSVLPAMLDGRHVEHPPLYFEFHERGFDQAARIGDWKAVRHGLGKPIELYDLKDDLGEQHDVAGQHPEVIKQFEDYLKTARVESNTWPVREGAGRGRARNGADAEGS